MQTFVIVFVCTRSTPEPARELVAQEDGALSVNQTRDREERTPPFWTWFIENPRPNETERAMAHR